MKIYRPVASSTLAQGFGENLACVRLNTDGTPVRPYQVIASMVCPPGYTKFYPLIGLQGHNGWDHVANYGEPVYFPVVAGVEWQAATEVDPDGGIGVNIRSKQPVPLDILPPQAQGSLNLIRRQYDKLGGKVYLYFKFWHLKSVAVYDFKPVQPGDLIGYADSTGASSGNHLHWSMKVSDETSWFCLDGDNGYTGALDFSGWYENTFILDRVSPTPVKPRFLFTKNLEYRMQSPDIVKLQDCLRYEGLFPMNVESTGFYGEVTRQAVLSFQNKYRLTTVFQQLIYRGMYCHEVTRKKLNELYA